MDLSKLRALQDRAQEEINEDNQRGGNNGLPLVYPFKNGIFRIKLLFDEKSGLLQRKLIRHNNGKRKIPCLGMYDEECPVCAKVNEIQNEQGRECGVFGKYGYSTKGICHAVLMNDDEHLFSDNDNVKVGDPFIFMYPMSLYKQINDLIVRSGDNIESLLANNNGKTIEIKRSQKGNGPIDYSASIYAYGDEKVRETDEEFKQLLEELPPITDEMSPSNPTEEIRTELQALVETMSQEYAPGNVINPNDESSVNPNTEEKHEENKPKNNGKSFMNEPESNESSSSNETQANSGDKPSCFGQHSDTENRCLVCPMEVDCIMAN